MLGLMDQTWERLKPGIKENKNNCSIISPINMTYSKTTPVHVTSIQAEIDKLFMNIICTAYAVYTTLPTKILSCENTGIIKWKMKAKKKALFDIYIHSCSLHWEKSNVMIHEITQHRRDCNIP